jgi:hypothetical protein
MQKHHVNVSAYQFRRAPHGDLIQVLNEGLYVMAEYYEQTGTVKWQRVVLASQREQIEKWLRQQYPLRSNFPAEARRPISAASNRAHKKPVLA